MSFPKFDESKDPVDLTDWSIDFSPAVTADDTITAVLGTSVTIEKSTATATGVDVTVQSTLFSGKTAILWLSDGKDTCTYRIGATISTANGRRLHRSVDLAVKVM